jgi:hypothetical protein
MTWALAALTGCAIGSDLEFEEVGSEAAQVTSGIWTRQGGSSGCADQCGAPSCSCIQDRCSASLEGQTCTPIGDTCNVVSGTSFRTLECEPPPPPPPPQTPSLQPGIWYRIASAHTGLCLGIASSSAASGAAVVQQICNGGAHQDWQVESPFSLFSRIINRNSNKCMDLSGNNVVQNPCDSRASELFGPNSGTSMLMDIHSGMNLGSCLEVPGGSAAISLQIQQAACTAPTCSPSWLHGFIAVKKQLWVFLPQS